MFSSFVKYAKDEFDGSYQFFVHDLMLYARDRYPKIPRNPVMVADMDAVKRSVF